MKEEMYLMPDGDDEVRENENSDSTPIEDDEESDA